MDLPPTSSRDGPSKIDGAGGAAAAITSAHGCPCPMHSDRTMFTAVELALVIQRCKLTPQSNVGSAALAGCGVAVGYACPSTDQLSLQDFGSDTDMLSGASTSC